jgi:hypothetical protein
LRYHFGAEGLKENGSFLAYLREWPQASRPITCSDLTKIAVDGERPLAAEGRSILLQTGVPNQWRTLQGAIRHYFVMTPENYEIPLQRFQKIASREA